MYNAARFWPAFGIGHWVYLYLMKIPSNHPTFYFWPIQKLHLGIPDGGSALYMGKLISWEIHYRPLSPISILHLPLPVYAVLLNPISRAANAGKEAYLGIIWMLNLQNTCKYPVGMVRTVLLLWS